MLTLKIWFGGLFLGAILNDALVTASSNQPCEVEHKNDPKACAAHVMSKSKGKVNCKWDEDGSDDMKCVVDFDEMARALSVAGAGRRSSGNPDQNVWNDFKDEEKFEMPEDLEELKKKMKELNLDNKELGKVNSARRNLNFSPFMLGLGSGLMGKPLFPECPVHVKFCYRVPCGGYGSGYLEKDPKKCLSDPRCCYDYKLAFMKKIFGPRFMGGAPACYYGATSKQWVYITNHLKPWNPFYTKFVLQAFEPFFNTNAYDFAGKLACSSDFGKKAYPVGSKSKLECNLVSGCWNEDFPEGHQCLMASDFIHNLFGKREVYPSLFTNDPSDTKCSADWFQYGPKAYNRMPCGVGPSPTKISDMLSQWCPVKECCLNYAMLSSSEKSEFMSYYLFMQNFGSGLSPFGGSLMGGAASNLPNPFGSPDLHNPFGSWHGQQSQTPWDPKIFFYLLTSSSSTDLSKIFCPYRKASGTGIFPDLSEFAEGCCDIPKCYHKKKLVRRTYPYPYPPSTTKPPVSSMWGSWGECDAPCGGSGLRTRECYVGHRHQPGLCPGHASKTCYGNACPVQYTWSEWSVGPCSRSCGGGYRPFRRRCYGGGKPVDPEHCLGPAEKSEICGIEECAPAYHWGQWTAGPCSRTCGGGYKPYRRICYANGKEVDPVGHCDGAATRSEICAIEECAPVYTWSQRLVQLGPCSVSCGQGYAVYGSQCVDETGAVVSNQLCAGRPVQQTRICEKGACPVVAEWGEWKPETPCGATCGPRGLRIERRICYVNGQQTDSSNCQGVDERIQRCAAPDCPTEYYWTGYTTEPCRRDPGGYCSIQRTRERSRRCYEFVGGQYVLVQPQTRCDNTLKDTIPCNPLECSQQYGGY